jgi:hypothetical protein
MAADQRAVWVVEVRRECERVTASCGLVREVVVVRAGGRLDSNDR